MNWFRLEGVNFAILPEVERDSAIREWVALLSSSRKGVVLASIARLRPDIVVMWSLDRFGRTMLDTLNAIMDLERRG